MSEDETKHQKQVRRSRKKSEASKEPFKFSEDPEMLAKQINALTNLECQIMRAVRKTDERAR